MTVHLSPADPPTTDVGNNPFGIAVGDFNRDKKLDLAVPNLGSATVSILLGNGDGTFNPDESPIAVGSGPISVAVGDFNRDKKLDLAVANNGSNDVSILQGDGNGNFDLLSTILVEGTTPLFVTVGSFNTKGIFNPNSDNFLDLAVTVANFPTDPVVHIFLGDGAGNFAQVGSPIDLVLGNPNFIGVGSFNPKDDNSLDLAVTNGKSNVQHNTVSILLGNDDGTFDPDTTPITVGNNPFAVVVGLFDDDRFLDLAVSNSDDNTVSILLGDGNGNFDPANPPTIDVGIFPQYIAVGDFDGDTDSRSSYS